MNLEGYQIKSITVLYEPRGAGELRSDKAAEDTLASPPIVTESRPLTPSAKRRAERAACAVAWLRTYLTTGERKAKDALNAGQDAEFKVYELRRAAHTLGVEQAPQPHPDNARGCIFWKWSLPLARTAPSTHRIP